MRKLSTKQIQEWIQGDTELAWMSRRFDLKQEELVEWKRANAIVEWLPPNWKGTPKDLLDLVNQERSGWRTMTHEVAAWILLRKQLIPLKELRKLSCKWAKQIVDEQKDAPFDILIALEVALFHAHHRPSGRDMRRIQKAVNKRKKQRYRSKRTKLYVTFAQEYDFDPYALAVAICDPDAGFAAGEAAVFNKWRGFREDLLKCFDSQRHPLLRLFQRKER